jgi:hypothetical protein
VESTLRVVLRVRVAERALATRLLEMLEILADYSTRFELLVIDEGGTDLGEEIGYGLAREYPQLRYARGNAAATKRDAPIETTLGDLVLVHRGHAPVPPSRVRRAWQQQRAQPAGAAR